MGEHDDLSEEYILELLKQDAKKVSTGYARNGVYDVLPRRPTTAAPKPNTRFLRNIIQNTDKHNTALREKELGDAGRRLRGLARERVVAAHEDPDRRARISDDGKEQDYSRKRKRVPRGREEVASQYDRPSKRLRDRSPSPTRDTRRSHRHEKRKHSASPKPRHRHRSSHSDKRHPEVDSGASEDSNNQAERTESNKSSRHATKSYRQRLESKRDPSHSRHKEANVARHIPSPLERNRQRSSSQSSTRSNNHERRRHKSRSHHEGAKSRRRKRRSCMSTDSNSDNDSDPKSRQHRGRKTTSKYKTKLNRSPSRSVQSNGSKELDIAATKQGQANGDDEDPLSVFLGPKLPIDKALPQLRGRGAASFASGIEQRFSSSYDPTSDMVPDSYTTKDEDWDQALEGLRDRQKFRQVGTDRLLAAGFTKEEVNRMEGGREKSELDVRWAKKGEAREWDSGKRIDENGYVAVDGDKFGRLT